jgi:hypothetical protein
VDGADLEYGELVESLTIALEETVSAECLLAPSPLQKYVGSYPSKRSCNDVILNCREDPALTRGRLLVVHEEAPEGQPLQSATTSTVLSILLPNGVAPTPHNVLYCDNSTTSDCVLRFLHLLVHQTLFVDLHGGVSPAGVLVHVDRLRLEVLRALQNRIAELQDSEAPHSVRLAVTVTAKARPEVAASLESMGQKQDIKILKQSTLDRVLASCCPRLPKCFVVTSATAGQGKTHAIARHGSPHAGQVSSAVWGGAQTRAEAAAALRAALATADDRVHLELHCFEEGWSPVDIDMLTLELLLFGSVFDPESASWVRLPDGKTAYVEVANTLLVKGEPLLQLAAPLLKCFPEKIVVSGTEPFVFDREEDASHETASSAALAFAIGGSGLLLERLVTREVLPVGNFGAEGAVLWLMNDGSVVAAKHRELLRGGLGGRERQLPLDVAAAATEALRAAWEAGREDVNNCFPSPSKATIVAFLTFLSRWVAEWARRMA